MAHHLSSFSSIKVERRLQLYIELLHSCTYSRLREALIESFKLISDVVAITSNLLAKSLNVEVGGDFQVVAGSGDALYFAKAELRCAPFEAILSLACEAAKL